MSSLQLSLPGTPAPEKTQRKTRKRYFNGPGRFRAYAWLTANYASLKESQTRLDKIVEQLTAVTNFPLTGKHVRTLMQEAGMPFDWGTRGGANKAATGSTHYRRRMRNLAHIGLVLGKTASSLLELCRDLGAKSTGAALLPTPAELAELAKIVEEADAVGRQLRR